MFRSYTLGKVAGIELKMHSTFLFLIILGLLGLMGPQLLFFIELPIVFTIVVLHELGHALTARRLGIPTRDILLTPIGGIATLTRMPSRPRDEMLITAAGPAVNVVLAALAWPLTLVTTGLLGFVVSTFLLYNVVLAAFNLIPAFPMDGGRLLRAFLTQRSGDYAGSTRKAARVGRWMALLLGIFGLFYNPMLIAIAVFIWFAGSAEEMSVNGGILGTLLGAAARRQQAQPPQGRYRAPEPEVLFRRPACHRRDSVVVDGEYTVVC